jgi:hypothetical protein
MEQFLQGPQQHPLPHIVVASIWIPPLLQHARHVPRMLPILQICWAAQQEWQLFVKHHGVQHSRECVHFLHRRHVDLIQILLSANVLLRVCSLLRHRSPHLLLRTDHRAIIVRSPQIIEITTRWLEEWK